MSRLLWIRSEAFDHGVFNTSVRWTVPKVLDFLGSLRAIVSSMNITRSTWVEVTTTRCQPALTDAEAAAYWHVFTVLQHSILGLAGSGDSLDIRIIGLNLMCQVFNPHRVRSDQFAKSGEMWPGHERAGFSSPRQSPRGSSPRVAVSAQSPVGRGRDASAALLAFVRQHLGSFLQIACVALTGEPANVSVEEFNVLQLILCAGSSFSQPLRAIAEALPELCSKKSLPLNDLKKAVEMTLVWNDEVYALAEQGQASADLGVGKTVNITGLSKTTTCFQRPLDSEIEYLNITACNDCAIYVTTQTRFCLIAGCHDCTIILSAVSALCTIHNCEKISVHVAAHCFKMENSIDSSAYLYCHVPPILTGDSRGIKLAPFNVLYSQMSAVLDRAGMPLEPDYVDVWAHPVCCTLGAPDETLGGRSGSIDEPNHSTYHFVHPANFQPVVVPEAKPRSAASPLLCLPQAYHDALKSTEEEMGTLHRLLAEIADEAKRKRVQQAIQAHFREWLQSTGKSRQLADLVRTSQQDKL